MKRTCVIGWPVNHSRSPLIHGYWLNQLGISGIYERIPVEPTQLPNFIQRIRTGEFEGCNVTLPHKENVTSLVDEPDDRVLRTGSANTLYMDAGKLKATSTDGPGFFANLLQTVPHFNTSAKPILILGAGGSASAIVDELLRQNATEIIVCNRTSSKAQLLAQRYPAKVKAIGFDSLETVIGAVQLMVNTTSAGIADKDTLDIPFDKIHPDCIVSDIVYTPLVTPLLQQARLRGHTIVTGLGMLLHQAVPGFEKWFGVRPDVTAELYNLVARDIDPAFQP